MDLQLIPAPDRISVPTATKTTACPVCRSASWDKISALTGYALSRCRACRMVWDPSPPSRPFDLYQQNYYEGSAARGGYADYLEDMKINRTTFRRRILKATRKLGHTGEMLDVGCALGDCLLEAKKLGWKNPKGLEVSHYAAETARSRGLDVHAGDLTHHPFKPGQFDLILLQDVIEHTIDPIAQLKAAYQLLKPGGQILVVTPNIEGFWSQVLGKSWYHYKPGEHLTYFSLSTMKIALYQSGFRNLIASPTLSYMSLEYVLKRLTCYEPKLFQRLLRICQRVNLNKFAFSIGTGELEAWARKPLLVHA
jgi:SAM-dependent methyltransferase